MIDLLEVAKQQSECIVVPGLSRDWSVFRNSTYGLITSTSRGYYRKHEDAQIFSMLWNLELTLNKLKEYVFDNSDGVIPRHCFDSVIDDVINIIHAKLPKASYHS